MPPTSGFWSRFGRTYLRTAVAAVIGASAAAAYTFFVGCRAGTCPITSSVWTASVYGGFVGALAGWPARHAPARAAGDEEPR